jgi:TonB family protein
LPNIVEWSGPSQPKLSIDEATLALARPKVAARARPQDIASPDVPNLEQTVGPINVAVSDAAKPALPLSPMSAPRAELKRTTDVAAPEIHAADSESARLIALSAAPGPDRPPEIPSGNLSARLAISPEVAETTAPIKEPETAPSGAGTGPEGLSISVGRTPVSSTSGVGRIMPGMPGRPAAAPAASPGVVAARTPPRSLLDRIRPGMAPEGLLGAKRVYTLHVNTPNLTSATGSWILSFAELEPLTVQSAASSASAGLSGPEPLRKVDPKYPPELRGKRVEGEVILYAVIREDGTVDSIQLVQGIDPTLDANAMQALAQWKFRPAERQGAPVEIEAVVRIPFRAVAPAY